MKLNLKYISAAVIGGALVMSSCTKSPDSPGYEYVPDMYRSQAIEAYVDYGLVGDDERGEDVIARKNTISARIPADGTIPFKATKEEAALNMPYPYALEQKEEAANNPLPEYFTEDIDGNIKEGKRLYNIFCKHCHGDKGQGDGGVVTVGGFNPPSPYNAAYKDRTMGSVYHTITHGTGGAMGSHASQISKEDRWKIVMYVNTLQHGEFVLNTVEPVADTVVADTLVTDSLVIQN